MSTMTSDELHSFINDVEPNVNFTSEKRKRGEDYHDFYLRCDEKFQSMIKWDSNTEYERCYPVVVYTLKNEVVGWYDLEMFVGYIK
jgi:guanylate kinase